jgi:hypothetical protein
MVAKKYIYHYDLTTTKYSVKTECKEKINEKHKNSDGYLSAMRRTS